ncbi:MAG: hypothetical protein IPN74_10090 [Haliscomenobacter sp.]|nr:hypothetical protein [Haliscomenobacter sp.]
MSLQIPPLVVPEKIHLLSIRLLKGSLGASDAFLGNPRKPAHISFTISHNFRFHFGEKRCLLGVGFYFEGLDQEKKPLGLTASYHLDFVLEVENLEVFLSREDAEIQVLDILAATLLGLCISTARGILYERTQGTPFEGIILPVVDPMKVLRSVDAEAKLPV